MKKLIALLLSASIFVCTTACKDKTPKTIIIDDLELDKTFSYEDLSIQMLKLICMNGHQKTYAKKTMCLCMIQNYI